MGWYEYRDRGGDEWIIVREIDTKQYDYEAIWGTLGLRNSEIDAANRIIDLYHSAFNEDILILPASLWMKSDGREWQRHQEAQYRTRSELERVAQDDGLVKRLIHEMILKLHPKWERHLIIQEKYLGFLGDLGDPRHPQAPYRLNIQWLGVLDPDSEPDYD